MRIQFRYYFNEWKAQSGIVKLTYFTALSLTAIPANSFILTPGVGPISPQKPANSHSPDSTHLHHIPPLTLRYK